MLALRAHPRSHPQIVQELLQLIGAFRIEAHAESYRACFRPPYPSDLSTGQTRRASDDSDLYRLAQPEWRVEFTRHPANADVYRHPARGDMTLNGRNRDGKTGIKALVGSVVSVRHPKLAVYHAQAAWNMKAVTSSRGSWRHPPRAVNTGGALSDLVGDENVSAQNDCF